jgi:hypothetical protein
VFPNPFSKWRDNTMSTSYPALYNSSFIYHPCIISRLLPSLYLFIAYVLSLYHMPPPTQPLPIHPLSTILVSYVASYLALCNSSFIYHPYIICLLLPSPYQLIAYLPSLYYKTSPTKPLPIHRLSTVLVSCRLLSSPYQFIVHLPSLYHMPPPT